MTFRIDSFDTRATPDAPGDKETTIAATAKLSEELGGLQERLFAEGTRSLLVVLQATDTGGKDGTIKQIFTGVNPAGVRIASFKAPTAPELAHDYLWRIHAQTPAKGELVIFNRSHYESVLVERVHRLVPDDVWAARYEQINAFEELLVASGTTVVKFFLHISKDEQKQRLLARLDDPTKHWKFNPGDLEERTRWDDYQAAFEDMVNKTSTKLAPWHVVPADRKWYRNFVVCSELVKALKKIDPKYPTVDVATVDRDFA